MSENPLICAVCGIPNDNPDVLFTYYRGTYMCEPCLDEWIEFAGKSKLRGRTDIVFCKWILDTRKRLEKDRE